MKHKESTTSILGLYLGAACLGASFGGVSGAIGMVIILFVFRLIFPER